MEAANTASYWPVDSAAFEPRQFVSDLAFNPIGSRPGDEPVARFIHAPVMPMIRAGARQEFRLGCQPCIDAVTGRITHLEALLRWPTAPTGITIQGLVESLERNGLILQAGAWVVRQACRDLALLRREGHKRLSLSADASDARGQFYYGYALFTGTSLQESPQEGLPS